MNNYIKVNSKEVEIVESLLMNNDIEYTTTGDPMIFVCEELVDSYIDNNVEDELRPLFRSVKEEMVGCLYEEANNILEGNFVIDVLDGFELPEGTL